MAKQISDFLQGAEVLESSLPGNNQWVVKLRLNRKEVLGEEMLESFSKNRLPEMDRSNFEKWKYDFFYKSDGKASKRILECVEKALSQQMEKT